jgi:hypothetical protein
VTARASGNARVGSNARVDARVDQKIASLSNQKIAAKRFKRQCKFCDKYRELFVEGCVTHKEILEMSDEDMKEVGIRIPFHQSAFRVAAREIEQEMASLHRSALHVAAREIEQEVTMAPGPASKGLDEDVSLEDRISAQLEWDYGDVLGGVDNANFTQMTPATLKAIADFKQKLKKLVVEWELATRTQWKAKQDGAANHWLILYRSSGEHAFVSSYSCIIPEIYKEHHTNKQSEACSASSGIPQNID